MQARSALKPLLGSDDWDWLQTELLIRTERELPNYAHLVYKVTKEELKLRVLVKEILRMEPSPKRLYGAANSSLSMQ